MVRNCFYCTGPLPAQRYTNHDGSTFCSEECILADHDMDEELHAYTAPEGWECHECGDTAEGLIHSNTWRNVEPLLSEDN